MAGAFDTNWIWAPDWKKEECQVPRIVYFRKEFDTAEKIKISANCRYKLYVNGVFVQAGPQKGTVELAYKDEADITLYLKSGKNVAAVEVLYYPEDKALRNDSLYYSQYPCLYIEDLSDKKELDGKEGWKCHRAYHIAIHGEPFSPAPIQGVEDVTADVCLKNWKMAAYDDSFWEAAHPYSFFDSKQPIAPFLLEDRTIPNMELKQGSFTEAMCMRECVDQSVENSLLAWNELLKGNQTITIEKNKKQIVEISAGEEMCGYPSLKMQGGKGTKINVLYAESYGISQPPVSGPMGERKLPPIKGDRTDFVNGTLEGPEDTYLVAGYGNEEVKEEYLPYLFRTFRFVRIEIVTGEEPITITSFDYISTGYPLVVKNHPISKEADYNKIWDISLRTLKRCMHETYVDCPFYEQLQYTMDSRAEMLFTYEVAEDDRLARACMEAFRKTQRYDGVIQASAPATGVNVIPGFNIFYILMVHDHMTYFKDKELVRHHFNCVDGILNYFTSHLTEKGLVGAVGGVLFQHRYWSFIDWCKEWNDTIGCPTATTQGDGSITMESLLLLYGLKKAAELADFIGRHDTALEYLLIAETLKENIKKYCIGEDGLIQDGPGIALYSTHCQVWGILNDLFTYEQAVTNLKKTYQVDVIPQCSVSMSFYLYLAVKKMGLLAEYDSMWDPWRKMLKNHMTTCVENTTDGRSDCHAWGSIMLYAMKDYCEKI